MAGLRRIIELVGRIPLGQPSTSRDVHEIRSVAEQLTNTQWAYTTAAEMALRRVLERLQGSGIRHTLIQGQPERLSFSEDHMQEVLGIIKSLGNL